MKLVEFIALDSILVDVDVIVKKSFQACIKFFAKNNLEESSKIIEKLNERERLGSTGVGNGMLFLIQKISL